MGTVRRCFTMRCNALTNSICRPIWSRRTRKTFRCTRETVSNSWEQSTSPIVRQCSRCYEEHVESSATGSATVSSIKRLQPDSPKLAPLTLGHRRARHWATQIYRSEACEPSRPDFAKAPARAIYPIPIRTLSSAGNGGFGTLWTHWRASRGAKNKTKYSARFVFVRFYPYPAGVDL